MTDTTLILIHLPKTGGASVRNVAQRNYHRSERLLVPGGSARDEREWMRKVPQRRRAAARLISGHQRYGLGTMLVQPWEYSVIIRHPAERIRSLFRWLSDNPRPKTDPLIAGGFEAFALGDSIADLDNGQTRMLATMRQVAGDELMGRPVNDVDFALASDRLGFMPVVGVADDLAGYIVRLAYRYGWTDLDLPHIHRAHHQLERDDDLMNEITERNPFDLALYEKAVSRG